MLTAQRQRECVVVCVQIFLIVGENSCKFKDSNFSRVPEVTSSLKYASRFSVWQCAPQSSCSLRVESESRESTIKASQFRIVLIKKKADASSIPLLVFWDRRKPQDEQNV